MNANLIAEITAEAISYIANLHNVTIPEVIENMMKGGKCKVQFDELMDIARAAI